jgi:molybdopterin-guanine dinucleotide biosynthesis protein A
MVSTTRVVGVILAGGKSSRMGGGDKCLLPLGGRPVLASVLAGLTPQVSEIVLNANGEASRFARFGLPVVADSVAGFAGPLAGVHAGLEWVKVNRPGIRYVVTVPSDTPFFPDDLVQRFLSELEHHPSLLVAASAEGVHPVVGLWPVGLARDLQECLEQGMHKVGAFTKQHGAVEVFFPPVNVGGRLVDPFFNINRPDELEQAGALLGHQPR